MFLGGRAAVVAVEQLDVVGIGSQHSQRLDGLRQRQNTIVLKQYHRLAGGLCGECVVLLTADDVGSQLRPRHCLGSIEHAQFEATSQRLAEVLVEHALFNETFLQTFGEAHEHLAALQIGAIEHSID